MKQTATDLRANLYAVLDHVAKTGHPVEIVRGGVELRIIRKAKAKSNRSPRVLPNLIVGDPDALIHMVWPWAEGKDL